ncbi:MAG: amino acid permease, partial [Gammaproteobacteria bacterium]
ILTTWNAFLVGSSRLVYALARDGQLPAWLAGGAADAHVPVRALCAVSALSVLAPWFGRPMLVWLINAGSLGVIVAYACVALAFLGLRRREPDMPRPYRVPAGEWVGGSAFVLALAIAALYLPFSPSALRWPQEWLIVVVWAAIGAALTLSVRRRA